MTSVKISVFLGILCIHIQTGYGFNEYDMDTFSDCERTVNVDDNGVKIHGRSRTHPSNPPLRCVIYLRSSYTRDDGSNKLQIEVEYLNIKDCNIKLDLYNGRRSVGEYLKAMSCQVKPSGVIYSKMNEVTVKLTRPQSVSNTEYGFTLKIKPYKDKSVLPVGENKDKLSIGAIIGIVIGCLVLVAVLILLCWCCCTGRISGFGPEKKKNFHPGHGTNGWTEEKFKPPPLVLNDPLVWSTHTGGADDKRYQPRYAGNSRYNTRGGGGGVPNWHYTNDYGNERSVDYESYDFEKRQGEGEGYYNRSNGSNDRFRNRKRNQDNKQHETDQVNASRSPRQRRKETLIDDVFDEDTNAETSDFDDATLQKRPFGQSSPKSNRKSEPIPEEEDGLERSPQLERYKSMDLQSQPDMDTITSPVHLNAGVMASVDDDDLGGSPVGSRRKNNGHRSPKAKHKDRGGKGKQPDAMAMPPEAFEPIFTEPISGINYPTNPYPQGYGQMAPQFSGGFMPYGLIPSGAFAPGVPGSQTYAYAYQTVPTGAAGMAGAHPASQGAFVIQNTPTSEGNRRTAFAVEETVSPDGKRTRNPDPFGRSPYRDSGSSSVKKARNRDRGYAPDLSVVTRGAAPPGQGHRSVALKSGTDPNTGIHTVQGVWTDSVADPTDPRPGVDNPQITRKTITRVTTKSGYGELPPDNDPLIPLEAEPAFLNPGSRPTQAYTPAIMPPGAASNRNIDFYTGAGSTVPPPERSSTPNSLKLHNIPRPSGAIRDRIPLDESTV